MRSPIFLVFIALFLFNPPSYAFVVTSLNIEWFGKGGEIFGTLEDEHRHESLSEYIHEVLPESDVYVFQEITDKKSLFKIMKDFECISYEAHSKHQFVVMCSKPGTLKATSVNHDVRLGNPGLRAALVGDYIVNGKNIRVVGVHLKSGRRDSDTRVMQVEALIKSLKGPESTVIIGDFNTYKKDRTSLMVDDSELVSGTLGSNFGLVDNEVPTYMGFGGRVFDRAWVRDLEAKADVIGPCNEGSVGSPYAYRSYYNQNISDHCALRVEVED